jgi:hypothetical protein
LYFVLCTFSSCGTDGLRLSDRILQWSPPHPVVLEVVNTRQEPISIVPADDGAPLTIAPGAAEPVTFLLCKTVAIEDFERTAAGIGETPRPGAGAYKVLPGPAGSYLTLPGAFARMIVDVGGEQWTYDLKLGDCLFTDPAARLEIAEEPEPGDRVVLCR